MPLITSIKNAILALGSGEFQNLCDALLNECGYSNIVALGTKAGTGKTTLGTPDTYCCQDPYGKYIFVEYTTQQNNIYEKISTDIKKCIDVESTGIQVESISEIKYFHTSSNISPGKDKELKDLCTSKGILLDIYGIDRLANKLFNDHKLLIHDYLGISVSTEQIYTANDSISVYNRAKTAAPINTEFMFRENEISSIIEMLNTNSMVLISGVAGVGKTRIALECGEIFAEQNDYKLYCIRNNNQKIYEDLYQFFNKPDKNIIIIDDANELSELDSVIDFFISKKETSSFIIIATVRDYALNYVESVVSSKIDYKKYHLNTLHGSQISELVKKELKITDTSILSQISRIANGNARIAYLAGKQFVETKTFDSIYNVLDLYKSYYGRYLNSLDASEIEMWKAAAITAFLGALNIDYLSSFTSVLSVVGLNEGEFITRLYELHSKEIIDIYKDKAIVYADQCMANYILYFAFIEKKLISLSQIIEKLFKIKPNCVIKSVNTLINLFYSDEAKEYIFTEIKTVWNEFYSGDKTLFYDFVKAFYLTNQTESLLIIKEIIDNTTPVHIDEDKRSIRRNNYVVNDDVLTMLCGLAQGDNIDVALDLLCIYYDKRQDLVQEFYASAVNGFGITKANYDLGFIPTIKFLDNIIIYSDYWKKSHFTYFFIEIAAYLLQFEFTDIEMIDDNRMNYITVHLGLNDGVKNYREKIWQQLIIIYQNNLFKSYIEKVLHNYFNSYDQDAKNVVEFDIPYIIDLYDKATDKNSFTFCKAVHLLVKMCDFYSINYDDRLIKYTESENYILFKTFCRPGFSETISWEQLQEGHRKQIYEYVKLANKRKIYNIIDFFCFDEYEYDFIDAINYAFDILFECRDYYIEAIEYYIRKNYEISILKEHLQIAHLFEMMTDIEVWEFISKFDCININIWKYYYFEELPILHFDQHHLDLWYQYLKDTSDDRIKASPFRNLQFLKNFIPTDPDVYVKSVRLILDKKSTFLQRTYLDLILTPQNIGDTIKLFNTDYYVLHNIYMFNISVNDNYDYDGSIIKEIYLVCPEILVSSLRYYSESAYPRGTLSIKYSKLFELEDYIGIFDSVLEFIIEKPDMVYRYNHDFWSGILSAHKINGSYKDRPYIWIKHIIEKDNHDLQKMVVIFTAISSFENHSKLEFFKLFLSVNTDYECFIKLDLFQYDLFHFGSEVPKINNNIEFLSSILPLLSGLPYLQHKKYIEEKIEKLKKRLELIEIEELIHGN